MGDNLHELLDLVRRELGIGDDVIARMDEVIRREHGATRVYIAARKKRRQLQALQSMAAELENGDVADRLGVSDRQARRLVRLFRG